jgi:hypothetical protein
MFQAFDPTKMGSSSAQVANMNVTKKEATLDQKKEGRKHYG